MRKSLKYLLVILSLSCLTLTTATILTPQTVSVADGGDNDVDDG